MLLAVPSVVAQVDSAITRSGEVSTYDGTRADFLTVAGKLSRYPRLSKAGKPLHYAPIVTTDSVPVSNNTATVYGNIVFNGWYETLTEQGFQLSTSSDFTNATNYPFTPVNAYVECDQPCAANVYSANLTGLTAGAIYYVRAYARNEAGITYAEPITFIFETGEGCPGSPFVLDHQNNKYSTVQIGYQCWTRENMRCTTLPSGRTMTLGYVPSQGTSNASYSYVEPYYYDCSLSDTILYKGYLYNWAAALDTAFSANSSDSYVKRQGICPKGWHVPSMDEWNYMLTYVMTHGNTDHYGCDNDSTKITKALSYDTTRWYSTTSSCAPGNDPSTNNLTQFSAYPANYYAGSGINVLHISDAEDVRFWSSSSYDNSNARYIGWGYNDANVTSSRNYKSAGYSVRCVRDTTGLRVPSLTVAVDSVTQETVKVTGQVTNDGRAVITERGICWSTDTLPTINNYKIVDATGDSLSMDEYIARIAMLTPNLTYHVRAYAINFEGVGYSDDIKFTMLPPANLCEGTPTVTDRDGNVYNTVQIGYQCWTRENMRCTTFPDGTPIGYGGTNNNNRRSGDTLKLYYNDTISTIPLEHSGYLYNWYAAMDTVSKTASIPYVSFEKRRGICPEGWHVPSITEWDTLVNYMSRQSEYMCREDYYSKYFANALASKNWWANPNYSDSCYVGVSPEDNNASGMSMIPTGYWGASSMSMEKRSQEAHFWSSTLYSNNSSYYFGFRLRYDLNSVSSRSDYGDQLDRGSAFPVRCLRDTTGLHVPTVTATAGQVGPNSASFNGEVTKDGGVAVTERGFCYSASSQTPTINDAKQTVGEGLGEFSGVVGNLVPGVTYYVRAYATNYEGTGYSDVMTITATTPENTCPNQPTVTDHEGNVYNTVQIGDQCWTRENMRCKTTPKNPNVPMESPYSTYSNYKPYFYTSPASDSVRLFAYGYLYNWAAAMDTTATDYITASFENRRGICPEGWHVPTKDEWTTLVTYVSSQEDYRCNGNANNNARALADQFTWQSYSGSCTPGYDLTQNNATGFTATAAGEVYRNTSYGTSMRYRGNYTTAEFWSATNAPASPNGYSAYTATIYNNTPNVRAGDGYSDTKWECHSVRCLKNEEGAVEKTVPTVTTTSVSNVTGSGAKFAGEVVSDGNIAETRRGFCWDYSENPDTTDFRVACGTGAGEFNAAVSNLQPGTTYYVRAYAINRLGVSYGEQVTFTTSSDFHVDTIPYVTDFSDNEAWLLNGNDNCWWMIGSNNGYYDGQSLFVTKDGTTAGHYGNNGYYQYLSAEKFLMMPAGDSIHVEFDALVGGYSYYCFMKALLVPISMNFSANTNCFNYSYSNNAANFAKYYGDVNHYYLSQANGMKHYSVNLPNPAPGDTCKLAFLWSKTNSSNYNNYQPGAIIANVVVSPVIVRTDGVSDLTDNKAKVTGSVQAQANQAAVTERGFCWSSTGIPTLSDSHVAVGSGDGSFTTTLTGLNAQTTYYVCAYATDQDGMTLYGNPVSFQTKFDKGTAHAVPYETSFEDAESWYLNNGTQNNYWAIGIIDGDSSLFVTKDGTTVSYNTSGSAVFMAERYLAMPQTDSVTVEFDVKAFNGEGSYDYVKVFLVPADQDFEAQTDNNGHNCCSETGYSTLAMKFPSGNYYFNNCSDSHISANMLNPTPGDTAKLVFMWRNDYDGGSNPPSCITSVSVSVSGDGVWTGSVSNITTNHATVGGYLPAGQTFTECGICYSTTENPTTADSKVMTGSGFTGGDFTVDLNLQSSTRYYARAYVVKGGETQYGAQVTFITHAVFPFTTDFSTNQSSWVSNHGDLGDYWTTGTVNGRSAMFVTDNGTDAHYDHRATVMMEKLITMPAEDSVNVTFDVMVGGESSYDYMKVFLVTAETEFTPGDYSRNETAAPYGYAYSVNAMNFNRYASLSSGSYVNTYKYMLNLLKDTVHVSEMMANPAANGVAKLVFLWTSDGASTQPGPIIMNLSVASAGIHTVSVTGNVTNTAVMKVKLDNPNGASIDEYGVCYSTTNPEPTMADSHAAATTGTASGTYDVTMTNLTPATRYYARAYMTQGGVTIYDTVIMFYTASSLPYQTDFNDASSWYMNNGTASSKWMVGDYNSGKALFVTSDGTTPGYSSGTSVVMAERVLAMPNDSLVTVAFDVKVGGESSYDYVKVLLVPSDSTFTAKNNNSNNSTTFPYGYNNSSFALNFHNYKSQTGNTSYDYILNLTNGNTLSISEKMVNPARNGAAKLVFVWTNDGGGGVQPGAIVSNLRVSTEGSGADFSCGTSKVADYDGNIYATVEIGAQCWMAENLRATKYSDGTSVSDLRAPDNNSANVPVYGYLYTWDATMNGEAASSAKPSGVKGICPTGWHVPSYGEFQQLETAADAIETDCGPARVLAAKEGWQVNGDNACCVGYNQSVANNSTGFTARPAGYYSSYGFSEFGSAASFINATAGGYNDTVFHWMIQATGTSSTSLTMSKQGAGSVRCVKN